MNEKIPKKEIFSFIRLLYVIKMDPLSIVLEYCTYNLHSLYQ